MANFLERGDCFSRDTVSFFGQPDNGNFMNMLEVISMFLKAHIEKYGNADKG